MARLELAISRGALLQFYEAMWGPIYEAVLNILGSTGTIMPVGDPKHGQPNATTFTTVGEEQVTFTWSEAPSSFDTALDLADPDSFQGVIPVVSFNGTDEEADTPDASYWSSGDGTNDSPFSVGMWASVVDTAVERSILAKYDSSGSAREWGISILTNDRLRLLCQDESAGVNMYRISDAAVTQGSYALLVITYDGAGGASAADGIAFYQNGVSMASTATNNASYVAMENTASTVDLCVRKAATFFNGKVAGGPLGPFFAQKELTADEVRRLYEIGRRALAL